MALSAHILSLCCCGLISIVCILYIVSNAVPKWGSIYIDSTTSSLGLWRTCDSNELATVCISITDLCTKSPTANKPLCDKLRASEAFMVIACIFSGLAALCFLVYLFMKNDSRRIILIACKILSVGSLIAGIIGVSLGIVSVVDFPVLKLKLDAAAIVGIVGVAINIFSAVLSLLIR